MEVMEAVDFKEQRETLICQCHSIEHQVSFTWIEGMDAEGEVYMEIHLSKLSFWDRLKHGIKYIFGYRCMYGDFDEVILKKEDVNKLEKVVEFLKK